MDSFPTIELKPLVRNDQDRLDEEMTLAELQDSESGKNAGEQTTLQEDTQTSLLIHSPQIQNPGCRGQKKKNWKDIMFIFLAGFFFINTIAAGKRLRIYRMIPCRDPSKRSFSRYTCLCIRIFYPSSRRKE